MTRNGVAWEAEFKEQSAELGVIIDPPLGDVEPWPTVNCRCSLEGSDD